MLHPLRGAFYWIWNPWAAPTAIYVSSPPGLFLRSAIASLRSE